MRWSKRYIIQWKTTTAAQGLQVIGYCIRDQEASCWPIVFEHTELDVCEKMLKILNEG